MSIRIVTDSASDLSLEEISALGVELIPMPLLCGADSCLDDKTMPVAHFWDMLISGTDIKTSQPSPERFLSVFQAAKAAGDEVVCVTISGKLSGTYQGAQMAHEMADYAPVFIVEGGQAAASVAEKMLVLEACRLRDEGGHSAAEIAARLEALKNRTHLYACLNTLEYLVRGGRLSRAVGSIGALARLKPIITFGSNGEISVAAKAIGEGRAMKSMVSLTTAYQMDPKYPIIPIFAHTNDNCAAFLAQLEEKGLNGCAPMEGIGATIGAYIGPGAYGIVFVEAE